LKLYTLRLAFPGYASQTSQTARPDPAAAPLAAAA
jgi:hypothetical protein